ncbi:CHAT domain-containing protein [candidate division KSB1 bacterium]|nr:CHAT domain-containing protein [candidate division KSB1 bacterium]
MRIHRWLIIISLLQAFASQLLADSTRTGLESDTLLARNFIQKAEELTKTARYDSSNIFYERAGLIYKRAAESVADTSLWESYVKCLSNTGDNLRRQGDYEAAMKYLTDAVSIGLKKIGRMNLQMAATYNILGALYFNQSDFDQALEFFIKSLDIKIRMLGEDHQQVGYAYNNIGIIYRNKGDYDNALVYYKKSLALKIKFLGERDQSVANTYSNIGLVYRFKGDNPSALTYSNKALAIYLELTGENHPYVAGIYHNIAVIHSNLGHADAALEDYQKSIDIKIKLLGENHPELATSYNGLGSHYYSIGKYQPALDCFTKALEIKRQYVPEKNPDIAYIYYNFGKVYKELGQLDRALAYVQKSIISLISAFDDTVISANPELDEVLSENFLMLALNFKAELLHTRFASVTKDLADLNLSLATCQLASSLIDKLRSSYQAELSKLFLGEEATGIFENAIETAFELYEKTGENSYKETAFMFAEKSKSAVLLESLQESKARQFAGIDDSLLEVEKTLKIDLVDTDTQIQKELQKQAKGDSLRIRQLQDQRFELITAYQTLMQEIENRYPEYYALKYQTQSAPASDLQSRLDDDSGMLEFFMGDSAIYVFVISKSQFDFIKLSKDTTFARTIDLLVESLKKLDGAKYIRSSFEIYTRLIHPLERQLAPIKKLIIIPHGILYKIPFEALLTKNPASAERNHFTKYPYLIRRFEVSYHYSATLYAYSLQKSRAGSVFAQTEFAGFSPVFSSETKNGTILASTRSALASGDSSEVYRAITLDGKRFNELTYSEEEVKQIVRLFQKKKKAAAGYFHKDASEGTFKATVGSCNIVHIATHGIVNEEKPQLSGIIFSQPSDFDFVEDGILYSGECYNLELNASLVVLSSCESGLGKLVRGEGLMALTRGFLYSGAANIVVSLWKVSDNHTSQLMVEFYKKLLAPESYSRALRDAKLQMIKKPDTAFPKSWSSFVLIGT